MWSFSCSHLRLLRKLSVNNYRNRKCSWQTRTGSVASCTLSCPSVAIVPNLCPDHVYCPRSQTHTRKDNARLHQSKDWDVHIHGKTFIINWDIHWSVSCYPKNAIILQEFCSCAWSARWLMFNWKILIGMCLQDYTFRVAVADYYSSSKMRNTFFWCSLHWCGASALKPS